MKRRHNMTAAPSIGKRLTQRALQVFAMLLEQAAARLLALSPLWLPFFARSLSQMLPFSSKPLSLAITLVLYLLIVYPLRSRAALTLIKIVRDGSDRLRLSAYPQLVLAGCLRLTRGALWGVPLAALLYRLYQYVFVFDGTRFSRDFTALGAFLRPAAGAEEQTYLGSLIFFGAILLCALLFLYGWWRGVPYDFQMVGSATAFRALRTARKVRRRTRGLLWKNAVLHALLCLPAIVVPLLIPYLKLRPLLTGLAMQDLQLIYVFVSSGMLSDGTLWLSLAAFLLLYLPFLPYRKARNAHVVVNCYGCKR